MNMLKIMTVVALGFGVAGCADVDTVSRNTPIPHLSLILRALLLRVIMQFRL